MLIQECPISAGASKFYISSQTLHHPSYSALMARQVSVYIAQFYCSIIGEVSQRKRRLQIPFCLGGRLSFRRPFLECVTEYTIYVSLTPVYYKQRVTATR